MFTSFFTNTNIHGTLFTFDGIFFVITCHCYWVSRNKKFPVYEQIKWIFHCVEFVTLNIPTFQDFFRVEDNTRLRWVLSQCRKLISTQFGNFPRIFLVISYLLLYTSHLSDPCSDCPRVSRVNKVHCFSLSDNGIVKGEAKTGTGVSGASSEKVIRNFSHFDIFGWAAVIYCMLLWSQHIGFAPPPNNSREILITCGQIAE